MAKKRKDMKDLSVRDLQNLVEEIGEELFQMKNELKASKKVEKSHLFRLKRKQRAQALTYITLKERQKVNG